MSKQRLEAFSDGVVAILITIMVLDLRVPQGTDWSALTPIAPVFSSYVLSFLFLAIYWNNHHHLLQTVNHVEGRILWANMHLLFWMSLIPFVTSWMGGNPGVSWPAAMYGVVLLFAAIAYYILTHSLIAMDGKNSMLADAVGRDSKGIISVILYLVAVPAAFFFPWISYMLYVVVAIIWLIPDRRIERTLGR